MDQPKSLFNFLDEVEVWMDHERNNLEVSMQFEPN